MMRTEQEMLRVIMKIATEDERIRAAYMHGSRANPKAETDKYSDYDIVFVVPETASFIKDKDWLNYFGDIAFVFEGYRNENKFRMKEINDLSCRYVWGMLFKDGNRIDLMIEIREEAMNHRHIRDKPTVVLLDKDNCLSDTFTSTSGEVYSAGESNKSNHEYKEEYKNGDKYAACCSGFWWFLNDFAKAVAREQFTYNALIRLTLNQMIDWYIGIQTDFSVLRDLTETIEVIEKDDEYYKKYLSAELYDLYAKTHSEGSSENFWNAIFSTCELFSKIAPGVGVYFGFSYNKQEENSMMGYLNQVKNGNI
jgi:aminoglycoside 6-adenylyltransferase